MDRGEEGERAGAGAGGAQRDESGEVDLEPVVYVFSFRILVEFILLQASAPTTHSELMCVRACVHPPPGQRPLPTHARIRTPTHARTHGRAHTRTADADGPARPCAKSWIDEARPAQRPARLRGPAGPEARPAQRPGHVW